MVFSYFQNPPNEPVADITTTDILNHFESYLNSNNYWGTRIDGAHFLLSLVRKFKVPRAYNLGVKIGSIPLIIQVSGGNSPKYWYLKVERSGVPFRVRIVV